ncbi:N-acetylmuramoyl-L-alanine amidase [Roseospira visakhapatnamensis]|uniref:N-acetylmuramoyl-L-alanine amidase n=1 Tax=Roseospira visakhapatnamensis TaxID=390880 RepID=A0A7W6W8F3_9PROT|nr:N-acetylmuramoyl-L-alanine amidase [Roseospira visakhapatnamensis]MBB4264768.1 N-acetylmuramoyl-L-alanine amidase [Roseospira visakhapatnamensis]
MAVEADPTQPASQVAPASSGAPVVVPSDAPGQTPAGLIDLSRRGLLVAGAGACGLATASGWTGTALAQTLATGFRLGLHASSTRVVVDVSARPAYRLFTLVDPPRLVLDLRQADWLVPAGALPASKGHVRGVRHGLLPDGLTRVVLDLDGPTQVANAFVLSPRDGRDWRLVIDLTTTTPSAFRAAAGVERAIQADPAPMPAPALASTAPGAEEPPPLPSLLDPVVAAATPPAPTPLTPVATAIPAVAAAPALTPAPLPSAAPAAFVPIPARKPTLPRKPVIALDPGHGGRDPGAISVNGVYEKDIVLSMAQEVRQVLMGTGRYRVFMTRDRDVSVRLRERVRRARQAEADLFLSIHADALRNPGVRGLSVYTLSEKASDAEAAALADRENKADIILGMDFSAESADVTNILIDLAQRETMNRSVRFANTLLAELPREVRTLNHSRRYAGFAVLKAPDVPSVLLEMGYLSNRTDEKLLRQRAYRVKLAHAVVRSLDRFFTVVQGAQRP